LKTQLSTHLRIEPSHPGQLSQAIPPWVGKTSSGNGYSQPTAREEMVSSVLPELGILTQLVKGAG